MILCITPNPALDRNLEIINFNAGEVCRSSSIKLSAGGKGVNVTRAIHCLRGDAICVGILGGYTGKQHAELAEREGLNCYWSWTDQETRAAVIVNDPASKTMTVINENGPVIKSQDWEGFTNQIYTFVSKNINICFCGSLPLGILPNEAGKLLHNLKQLGCRTWVDTSGKTLDEAILTKPDVIKINNEELASLLNIQIEHNPFQIAETASHIITEGVEIVIVTIGKQGAVLVDNREAWHARPPEIQVVSPIGSGDAFLAGLVTSYELGYSQSEMLRRAVAAGTANALTTGAGFFLVDHFNSILPMVDLEKLY